MSTLSSLEVTRNPFDSNQEERLNCPGFSPSMFRKQETPASQKVSINLEFRGINHLRLTHRVLSPYIDFFILSSQKSRSFRWSIDQISRLVSSPTDTLKFTVHYPILCRSDPRFVFTSKLIVII